MTRIFFAGTLGLVCLLAITGCNNTDPSRETSEKKKEVFTINTVRKEIDKANLKFIALFNRSDSAGLANMFTSDGKSMEPNQPAFVGRKAIQTHYSTVMKAGAHQIGLVTTGLWGDLKMLTEEGEYTLSDNSGKQLDKGKYLVLWKIEDGEWKLFRDCYNSDLPL